MKWIHAAGWLGLFLALIAGCSQQPNSPNTNDSKGALALKVNSELEGAEVSLTPSQGVIPLAERIVSAGDSTVAFGDLDAGPYTLSVEMPDGRTFTTTVVIEPGKVFDLGTIAKIDSSDIGIIRPAPGMIYPAFIAWHYPSPNEKVVFDQNTEPYFRGGDPVGLEMMPCIRVLGITFQFAKPMNRESIEKAFSVSPGGNSAFSWNYCAPYLHSDSSEPYILTTDRAALVEENVSSSAASGGGVEPAALPMPEPVLLDTSMVFGFTYYLNEQDVVLDTVYEVAIAASAKDSAGNMIGEDYRFRFFVVSAASPYPFLITKPAVPISTQAVELQLVLGMSQSACDPQYSTSFSLSGQNIYLSYSELQTDVACIMIAVDPHPYGPEFNVGKLSVGEYSVYNADSTFAGAFSVSGPVMVNGTVLQMEDPSIVHIRAPVLEGVAIIAESNPGCGYWYMPVSGTTEKVTTVSDANGRFTLSLSPGYGAYKITAEKQGFYGQVMFWNSYPDLQAAGLACCTYEECNVGSAGEITFEMLDTTQIPLADLEVSVSRNNAAAESACVYLNAGNMYAVCPMASERTSDASAQTAAGLNYDVSMSYSGVTGADGKLTLAHIALTPFIEFSYYAYTADGAYASGVLRLNKFASNRISIALEGPYAIKDSTVVYPADSVYAMKVRRGE